MLEYTALLDLADEHFISLTTFRRTGAPVSTPVWIARDGDTLIVTTPSKSGKVKRLRNSSRVELVPCGRMGAVKEGAVAVSGVAEILEDDVDIERLTAVFRKTYGLEYHLVTAIERLRKSGRAPRVMLRITGN